MIRGFRSMGITSATGGADRHEHIVEVISSELDRQAHDGAIRIDVPALAEAIESVLEDDEDDAPAPVPEAPPAEGKRPDDLNATNDD